MLNEKICPYPGLRPFTEDESIYFKGREDHIEKIIAQLEEKKFVMLTGASGDGKSSIVYAGVIPNARAGFFKAKFNNWLIADFRPERSPLKNLAISLSEKLRYNDVAFVERELGFGFSSLIKLYKNSPFHLDYKNEVYLNADEKGKKTLKRKAANLFILVDQFEEFFTNAENYHNGTASINSQAVLNLLLETAMIALAEDLPIYIICTMRSDYIGQCAAFRGLPEYIGFSQFFVPRLKRKEIQQVIVEPAILSGNKISNRLTETLINEIGDGFDQLPVLQHALNQIWTQADKGSEEMDLIHLAKLSGLPDNYLPANDRQKFTDWFNTVPDFKKAFFKNPSLENVLNTHANELYETASEYYNNRHEQKITKTTAQHIIKVVFQCLTKIDASRAVRNRMTLGELTNVIDDPEITTEVVGDVLDYFRLQGNTFLKPFIISDETDRSLVSSDVLDITHESLIRNWDLLTLWAKEEHENYLNYLDFDKQLQRWQTNNKDKGYLLPIGPLTFFEKWYTTSKPNKYWLARYDESEETREQKLNRAEEALKLGNEFLRKSARSLFFSRYVLKHGVNKLVTYIGIIVLVISCSFYYYDYTLKQNDHIIKELEGRGIELLNSVKVGVPEKAEFVIKYERLHPGSFGAVLNQLNNDTLAFDIAANMFGKVQNFSILKEPKEIANPLVYSILSYMDGRLENLVNRMRVAFGTTHSYDLGRVNKFLSLCAFVKSYNDDETIDRLINKNTWTLNKLIVGLVDSPPDSVEVNISQFNNSIQLLLALDQKADFNHFLKKLSPFEESADAPKRFTILYADTKKQLLSNWDDQILPFLKNNEGYHILACLYAADNKKERVNEISRCLDTLIKNNLNYGSNNNYYSFYDIISTLSYYNNYTPANVEFLIQKFISTASGHFDLLKIMERISNNNFDKKIAYGNITEIFAEFNYYANYFCSNRQRNIVWDHHFQVINNTLKAGGFKHYENEYYERNKVYKTPVTETIKFNKRDHMTSLVMLYKKRAAYCAEISGELLASVNYYDKAFELYKSIDYPEKDLIKLWTLYPKMKEPELMKLPFMFLYPVAMNENIRRTFIENGYSTYYDINQSLSDEDKSSSFFNYVLKNSLTYLYKNEENVEILDRYLYNHYNGDFGQRSDSTFYDVLDVLIDLTNKRPSSRTLVNTDFISIVKINESFYNNETAKALQLFSEINLQKIIASDFLDESPQADYRKGIHYSAFKHLARYLAQNDRVNESFLIANAMKKQSSKRNLFITIARDLQEHGPIENTFIYLDSLFKNNDLDKQPQFGMKLIEVLNMTGNREMFDLSGRLLKDVPEGKKPQGMINFIRGVAYNGYYYEAMNYVPKEVSSNKELQLYNEILNTEVLRRIKKNKKHKGSSGWESIDKYGSTTNEWDDFENYNR